MAIKTASGSGLTNSLNSGLVLLNTTSFSGVASQTVSGVFSSTYDNYMIVFNSGSSTSNNSSITMQLGATATGYYQFGVFGRYNVSTVNGDNKSNASSIAIAGSAGLDGLDGIVHLFSPNAARLTTFETRSREMQINGTSLLAYNSGGYLNNTTQYTAFTVTVATGTMTGSISTYGFNK